MVDAGMLTEGRSEAPLCGQRVGRVAWASGPSTTPLVDGLVDLRMLVDSRLQRTAPQPDKPSGAWCCEESRGGMLRTSSCEACLEKRPLERTREFRPGPR
eukprot:11343190-Alexandrium_andersonii.AAC.1